MGTCPNIEVEIDVTDKTPLFIRPFHAKEEDKNHFWQRNEKTVLFRHSKGSSSAYSSPIMLISRKMAEDKRVVSDFRHLNMCIAKNNLGYSLLKDTFALLGSSSVK